MPTLEKIKGAEMLEDIFGLRYRYGLLEIEQSNGLTTFEVPSLKASLYLADDKTPPHFTIYSPSGFWDFDRLRQALDDAEAFLREDPLHLLKK